MATTERLSVKEIPDRKRPAKSAAVLDFPRANLTQIMDELEERICTRLTDHMDSRLSESQRVHLPPPEPMELNPLLESMSCTLEVIRSDHTKSIRSAVAASVNGAALGVFQAIASLLAVRLLLLLTLCGGFTLALSALHEGTPVSVAVLVAYALLFIFPVAALEYRAKSETRPKPYTRGD